jgi:AcrR family transcriptional regulator
VEATQKRAGRADATRRKLLEVARGLFAERGYEATPIEDVLAKAGLSKGALYHHFPNKEALFEGVFEDNEEKVMQKVKEAIGPATSPLERLRRGCQAWLDITMDPAVRCISFIDGPAVLGWDRWHELDEKYGFGVVKHALEHAMAEGEIPAQSVDITAHILLAALGQAAMIIARSDDPAHARVEAGDAVDRLIDGLRLGR